MVERLDRQALRAACASATLSREDWKRRSGSAESGEPACAGSCMGSGESGERDMRSEPVAGANRRRSARNWSAAAADATHSREFRRQVDDAKRFAAAGGWLHLGSLDFFHGAEKVSPDPRLRREREMGRTVMLFVLADGTTYAKALAETDRPGCDLEFHGAQRAVQARLSGGRGLKAAAGGMRDLPAPVIGVAPAPVLPVIQGGDDLWPVEPISLMEQEPYRWIGKVTTHSPLHVSPHTWQGTGALVGPRHVITAGHAAFEETNDIWLHLNGYSPSFRPGQFAEFVQPNGAGRQIVGAWAEYAWVYGHDRNADLGWLLLFDEPRTAALGHFPGFCTASSGYLTGKTLALYGYPASKWATFVPGVIAKDCKHSPLGEFEHCGGYMYRDINWCRITDVTSKRIFYDCDTLGGMSGGPLWAYHPDGPACIFGVHQAADQGGARITEARAVGGLLDIICAFPSSCAQHWGCP